VRKGAFFPLIAFFLFATFDAASQGTRGLEVVARQLGGETAVPGKQIAVLIAVNRYKEWLPLKNPVPDAREIRGILEGKYYMDSVVELYDEGATKVGILKLFERLVNEVQAEDSIFIYYAGHGHMDASSDTGFWIPQDAGTDPYEQRNWLPNVQLRGFISKMKARHVALVSDSCFSGDILNTNRGSVPAINDEYFKNAFSRRSRQVLTSGASETVPDASSFSRAFKRALSENRKPYLDPLMIFNDVRLSVSGTTPLLGTLKDVDHQEGGSFIFFLKQEVVALKTADLMIIASVAGAEIFVDGVSKGKAPVLVTRLPAEKALVVEAKGTGLSGKVEVSLKPGELKEISLDLKPNMGNLFVDSAEKSLVVWIDGAEKGSIGNGIFRDLAVGQHRVELRGKDLYFSSVVNVSANETLRLEAKAVPVGKIEIDVPAGAKVLVSGKDLKTELVGPGLVKDAPAGPYSLSSGGGDFLSAAANLELAQGATLRWRPYVTGAIAFAVQPADAVALIEGRDMVWASGTLSDLAPGTYSLTLGKPGSRDQKLKVEVSVGRIAKVEARLAAFGAASVSLPAFPAGFVAKIGGEAKKASGGPDGSLLIEGLPAGKPLRLEFEFPLADSLELSPVEVRLAEGETRTVDIPAGRLVLPWMPAGAQVEIGKGTLSQGEAESGYRSFLLPAGAYTVTVKGKGRPGFSAAAKIAAGAEVELAGYREMMLAYLKTEQARIAKSPTKGSPSQGRKLLTGIGIGGAAGAALSFVIGTLGRTAYGNAATVPAAIDARKRVENARVFLPIFLSVSGASFGLSFLAGTPKSDQAAVPAGIEAIDEGIKALQPR
jgi:hypothetical protein